MAMDGSFWITGPENHRTRCQASSFAPVCCVTLSTLLNPSGTEFSHIFGRDKYTPLSYLIELLTVYMKVLPTIKALYEEYIQRWGRRK